MKFLLGTKLNMTQVFDDSGKAIPVTVISAGPIVVTKVKTIDSDKYQAVQVGYGDRRGKRVSKAVKTALKDLHPQSEAGLTFKHLKEFRTEAGELKAGETIDVSAFAAGDDLVVTSTTKAKGFQGVVKRHGFAGGRRTHGQKHSEREPGSIGATAPQRVLKGVRMAGRMGGDRVTVKNLTVVQIDKDNNLMLVSGAIPGRRGTLVEIRSK